MRAPELGLIRLHHVGIAVRDLDQAVALYAERFGLVAAPGEPPPGSKLRFAMIRLGDVELELMAPRADDSPISRFLERRGEGVHHLALETRDIGSALASAAARGLEGLSPEPLPGVNDTLTCFFHPRSTLGVLYEFVEPRLEALGADGGGNR